VSNAFAKSNPAFCEFLKKYHTSSALTSEGLAYMQANVGSTYGDAAKWFLTEHSELIDQWLSADQAAKLRTAL
ncbi:MAG: ABC transporter permease, partial [Oscillospiraceae bacterium]